MKTILVTGCSRGIGKAIAEAFLKQNWQVHGTSTTGSFDIQHINFVGYKLDLASDWPVNLFSEIKNLDLLVNNAAILLEEWGDDSINIQQLRQTFDVNVFGLVSLTEKIIPKLHKDGSIFNISSNWGAFTDRNFSSYQPHYKMSKVALNMYTKLLAEKHKNLFVASIDPGWVKSDMGSMDAEREPEEIAQELVDLTKHRGESGKFWHKGKIRDW